MGYAHNNKASPGLKKSNDQSFIEVEEAFLDSILDFDGWVEDHSNILVAQIMDSDEQPSLEKCFEVKTEKEEVSDSVKLGDLGSLIQEGLGRVRLTSGADVIDGVGSTEITERNDVVESGEVKNDTEKGGDKKDESGDLEESGESATDSSSSSSSSDEEEEGEEESDDDDDDDSDEEEEGEMEEGEIRDLEAEEMVGWSDEEEGDVVKGPIRSKNEVQQLPHVPPVNVTIEPHHQTLPVGVVLSIMGAQVIVEGVENHNPLSEGSILWITESRLPLGVVDEIFGPVKNPYYMVRYNSETEVPTGIQQGCLISFVPQFADYVLNNNNNLYKKGYDASGENDEELDDEIEFSDDDKEAEYKKMKKMTKRRSTQQKNGNTKKDNKSRNHQPSPTSQVNSLSATTSQVSPAFSPPPNVTGPSGVWPNGFTSIQPQNMGFPSIQTQNMGFPPNGYPSNISFMQHNFMQQPFQNLGIAPFHPQLNANGQMFAPNFGQGVPPNFGVPQNGFNQSQVGPFQGFPFNPSMNVQPQGVAMPNGLQMGNNGGGMMANGLQMENNVGGMRPPMAANGLQMDNNGGGMRPPMANGFPNRGGRKPFQRGGGRFRGGRSGQQSR